MKKPKKSPVTERAVVARLRRKLQPHWDICRGRDPFAEAGARAWLLVEGNTVRDSFGSRSALERFARERECLAAWEALEDTDDAR
jgi:hypothetical protein